MALSNGNGNGNGNNNRNSLVSSGYKVVTFGEGTVRSAKRYFGREDGKAYFQIKLAREAGGASLYLNDEQLVEWAASLSPDAFEQEWNAAQVALMVDKKQGTSSDEKNYFYYTLRPLGEPEVLSFEIRERETAAEA